MLPRAVNISDGVWQVGGPELTALDDAAIYLIDCGGDAALIDAGSGNATDVLLANVEAAGIDPSRLRWLLLTHCHYDHAGGAYGLREQLGCRVFMHAVEAPFLEAGDNVVSAAGWYRARIMPCPVDEKLEGEREDLSLGNRTIVAVAIPGHSPGSVAYYIDGAEGRLVFAQDVHGPLHPTLCSNADAYQTSLQRLLNLRAAVLCEGHFGIFRGNEAIADFIGRFVR